MVSTLIGYFTRAEQTDPTYDPPHDGPCIVCFEPLTPDTVRTVSVRAMDGERSYFYRLHRACGDALSADDAGALDSSLLKTTEKQAGGS